MARSSVLSARSRPSVFTMVFTDPITAAEPSMASTNSMQAS